MSKSSHRILQIHVTRKCNLKCLHCYSSSGPDETEALEIEDLCQAITDAETLGYTFVTISGGEPFLYPELGRMLKHAKGLGLYTGVVTNGMFLDRRRLEALKDHLDLIVISLDGAPDRHNRMRLNPQAFEVMHRKLPDLRDSGINFGFLFTLSDENAHEVEWAAEFASDEGAAMLQVHPLETEIGRAAEHGELAGLDPATDTAMQASRFAMAAKKKFGDALRIVVDFHPRAPGDVAARMRGAKSCGFKRFCDLVPTLCIETDGTYIPMGHGFSRQFEIGRLGQGRLVDLAQHWKASEAASVYEEMVVRVNIDANREDAPILQNMAKTLRRASFSATDVAAE